MVSKTGSHALALDGLYKFPTNGCLVILREVPVLSKPITPSQNMYSELFVKTTNAYSPGAKYTGESKLK